MRNDSPPLFVALTVDVDPDANRPARGRPDAVSAALGDRVSLRACRDGLARLGNILAEFHIPCTLFWEARSLRVLRRTAREVTDRLLGDAGLEHGCHGLRHEDFSGRDTGIPLERQTTWETLREATRVVTDATGRQPQGFRAPYCRLTTSLRRDLSRARYRYDATLTRTVGEGWAARPYPLFRGGQVWELALPRGRDRRGRPITGYLWQLFEGRRCADDYVEFAGAAARHCPGGLFQLALHPWHLVVNEKGEPLAGRARKHPVDQLCRVLAGVESLANTRFVCAGRYLEDALQQGAA